MFFNEKSTKYFIGICFNMGKIKFVPNVLLDDRNTCVQSV